MTLSTRAERAILLFALIAYYLGGYFALGVYNQSRSYYVDVGLPFEAGIPFMALFVVPYSLVPLNIVLGFLTVPLDQMRLFRRGALLFAVNLTASFILFLAVPVRAGHRPEVLTNGTLLIDATAFWFWIDRPTNLFPSLHVDIAVMSALMASTHNRRLGAVCMLVAAGVICGAIFLHQHYLADVVAGVLLASVTWYLCVLRLEGGSRAPGASLPAPS